MNNSIQFYITGDNQTEVMRITRDNIWTNPDVAVDKTAEAVLDALRYQVSVLVQKAVEEERAACAKLVEEVGRQTAISIRARGEK